MTMVGENLPLVRRTVTACDITMGAAASRDWHKQHHDYAFAQAMGLPDIIMNAPTQCGWMQAYAMAWAGDGARIGRWKLSMLQPVCPGHELTFSGTIEAREDAASNLEWVWLDINMSVGRNLSSRMKILLCRAMADGATAYAIAPQDWVPPPLASTNQN